jgi:Tol biopolymer transport system component
MSSIRHHIRTAFLAYGMVTASAIAQVSRRVSVDSLGAQANDRSWTSSISTDGRFVAFSSSASNLVTGDDNGFVDVFVHDRETGTTERVSVSSSGAQANGPSKQPVISVMVAT